MPSNVMVTGAIFCWQGTLKKTVYTGGGTVVSKYWAVFSGFLIFV